MSEASRAAAYVRMSTEHQQYSTENQSDVIRDYAAKRGLEIVQTFADAGKSGLRIDGRAALKSLIDVVQSGKSAFRTILVYDVSRWGRFQDADESAYYEYICKRAGITVQYCAEQFENDGGPTSTIIKSVKRAMHKRKHGKLNSGRGGKGGRVKSRKQAIAIGLNEARKKGAKVPKRGKKKEPAKIA